MLRSDGQLLFAEHTLARHAGPRAVQRAITPVWKHVAGGCHLDRDSLPLLEQAGFVLEAHAPRRDRFALVPTWWGTARPAP